MGGAKARSKQTGEKIFKRKRVFTPRFVSEIIKMANDENPAVSKSALPSATKRVDKFVAGHDWAYKMKKRVALKRDNPNDLTPKINFYKPDAKLMSQPDRHVTALQRESLYGAAPDCYVPAVIRKCAPQKTQVKGLIAPHNSPMIYKKSSSSIYFGPSNYNNAKIDHERGRAPPYASQSGSTK